MSQPTQPAVHLEHPARHSPEWEWAVRGITDGHYLHKMPDPRTSSELFVIVCSGLPAGALVFGRPEATRCGAWYGSVSDVAAGRCEVTRWQILNLARVWLHPGFQLGGINCRPGSVPGFTDRHGIWRPSLATAAIQAAVAQVGYRYLELRPPCFLNEPYEIRHLLSYCDTRLHKGTIYQAAGFHLYRTNERGIQTWRKTLPALSSQQDLSIRLISATNARSARYRAQRAQLALVGI